MPFGVITLFLSVIFVLSRCSDDAGTISGTVSLDDGTVADGAIVSLSKSANAAEVVATAVADADGIYSLAAIEGGTYFISATWEPSNNNNLKAANTVILSSEEMEIDVKGDVSQDITLSGMMSGGSAVIDLADWTFDNTHSTIEFEFPYDAINAVFTGHFGRAGFDALHFEEADPAGTEIKAWVDLISVETGSAPDPCGHTRDGIEGCIGGTFGVDLDPADTANAYCMDGTVITNWPNETLVAHDLWGDASSTTYTKQSAVIGNTGVATLEVDGAIAYGTGYKAQADFTFNGTTHSVDLYFNYLEGYSETSDTETEELISFYGWFKFAALESYGISSGHVGDADVTVKISAQFNRTF